MNSLEVIMVNFLLLWALILIACGVIAYGRDRWW